MNLLVTFSVCTLAFLSLVSAACPGGYVQFGTSCFKVVSSRANWAGARKNCEDEGARLAMLETREKSVFITSYLKTLRTLARDWWIGGHRVNGEWMWVAERGDISAMDGFTNWSAGEPGPIEGCAEIRSFNLRWNDVKCDYYLPYICEKDDY